MKVITEITWTKEIECTGRGNGNEGCGSTLEIERGDLHYYPAIDDDSWGSRVPAVMFRCCVCGALNDLHKDNYPHRHGELPKATTEWRNAPVGKPEDHPLAYTKEETRDAFLSHLSSIVRYWARPDLSETHTIEERLDGLAFSMLTAIDGSIMSHPAVNLSMDPHDDDLDYHIQLGEKFFTDQVFNDDVHLHDMWNDYRKSTNWKE